MSDLIHTFLGGYSGYASYLYDEITHPSWHNYFYWLILVSAFFFILEYLKPWREDQKLFRKDFWLDFFYMFFNFFIFSLIIYNAASSVVVDIFNDMVLNITDIDLKDINPLYAFPMWAVLLTGFLVRDFVQWWTHRLLHKSTFLWNFHKVHHSVEEMGFAAHLRYHWMETVVYRTLEYIPLAMIGIGFYDFFVIHIFTLIIGHYNHSNISVDGKVTSFILGILVSIVCWYGLADVNFMKDMSATSSIFVISLILLFSVLVLGPLMKYIFNSPEMHIWHHSYELPKERMYGVNFGISLAIWDYIFRTNYIPHNGKSIKLGFPGMEHFPSDFIEQSTYGFKEEGS